MATVFENYDAARTAFINPGDCVKAQENFPEVCITTFSESIIEDFAKKNSAEKIAELYTASSTIRDEGTSYHYLPAGEEIGLEDSCAGVLEDCLLKTGMPYVKGKIWTTDGIYRETQRRLKERKEQGCIAVEMECSAILAVCRIRGVPAIQFLYGADSLSTDKWEPRDLMEYGIRECDRYMALALECGARL